MVLTLAVVRLESGIYAVTFSTDTANITIFDSSEELTQTIIIAVLDIALIAISFWDIYEAEQAAIIVRKYREEAAAEDPTALQQPQQEDDVE